MKKRLLTTLFILASARCFAAPYDMQTTTLSPTVPTITITLNKLFLSNMLKISDVSDNTFQINVLYNSNEFGTKTHENIAKSIIIPQGSAGDQIAQLAEKLGNEIPPALANGINFSYDGMVSFNLSYALGNKLYSCAAYQFQPPYDAQTYSKLSVVINGQDDGSCSVVVTGS